ncbi:plasmid pRiA4b ORF-3 family protein [Fluviicola chungangensis]|uniref:Plasmid pRiA4b ORF-3 family protein n=1 Tax=Fluviicola chungangensis TaxID=2597671 RepID=A0A556N785_9FLAO|nr:plasmid pRiA4b ORF-3 family protein [Fluviicola chungangensis]TSJ48044.1 plasmid pRiA4b ORF-3 family protein [Fluviicola chungangensis]
MALKFRVLLDSEKDQEIFRDILINEDDNFESFYRVILNSFNFEGQEIGSFFMSNDEWDKGHEISLMDMSYSDEDPEITSVMSEAKLADFMEVPDQKIILVYDFLRMWIFLIELQERTNETLDNPKIALAVGTAPPEDSKMIQDDAFFGEEEDEDFNEFDEDFGDGYDEDDLSGYEEYDY